MAPPPKIDAVELFRLWNSELTPAEICVSLKISRSYLSRLQQQYKLSKKHAARGKNHIADPSPEEIAERAREQRKKWTETEREARRVGPRCQRWTVPAFTYDGRIAAFSSANIMD
jgi:DNA-directed RNA polymerase specialized sigma subunit